MIQAWDNPNYADRYTIVIGQDVFAMSDQPSHPQGINQFCGELGGRLPPLTKDWGQEVDVSELPKTVQEAVNQRG
jgi:hypothetical protein